MAVSSSLECVVPMEMITTAAALEQATKEWMEAPVLALDTEFFWETTFYPVLGVVQVATGPDRCWLVDAVQVRDFSALGPVLASRRVTKVLHDAVQDLAILKRATGVAPCAMFDTRLAAGFAGRSSTCSLQSLLHEVMGVVLSKAETRSNWLRRPLSPAQLRYAADDVIHLPALRERLLARCANDRVRGWLMEEQRRMDDPANYEERDPREMFRRVKGHARLNARQLAILREVTDWREQEARQRDWPRGHVLPDDLLIELSCRAPRDRLSIDSIPGWPSRLPPEVADAILAVVERGVALQAAECPTPAERTGPSAGRAQKTQTDARIEQVRRACAPFQIDPALVASRADLEECVRAESSNHALARGWRRELMASAGSADPCKTTP